MSFKKNTIAIGGEKIYYWEKNKASKVVMVCLHGFPGSHTGMVEMAEEINNYRIIIPDLPGCGESEPFKEKNNLERYAKWLNDFFDKLHINKAIIVGHSFGARVAVIFGADYPEKVEKLVLITPVVEVDSFLAKIASLDYKFTGLLPEHMQKAWLFNGIYRKISNALVYKTSSPERRRQLVKNTTEEIEKVDARANIEVFSDFYSGESIADGEKIEIKSLMIVGEKDEIATLNSIKKLYNRFTNADIIIIKGAGHLVVLESPIETADIIKKWLS